MQNTKHRIIAHEDRERCKIQEHHFVGNKEIRERVRQKAYELYESRGYIPGRDLDDWLEAERIVTAERNW